LPFTTSIVVDYTCYVVVEGALQWHEGDNPSRDVFKTKADVVKFVQEAVADGARVIHKSLIGESYVAIIGRTVPATQRLRAS
jgi:hypothetical protein